MIFLYDTYHPNGRGLPDIFIKKIANKKTAKKHPKVIFEDIKKNLEKIGMVSEKFALNWEKDRLIGLGHKNLVNQIVDRRDRPSYGYDFLSHSKPGHERYIEVKTAGKSWGDEGFRFFLSENQLKVSRGNKDYYFYLVFYGGDRKPSHVWAKRADELYATSDLMPYEYLIRFDIETRN